jgi:hypothetical protein
VQKPPGLVRQEAIDEEVVLLEVERLVLAFEVAGAVAGDAVTQDEVLGPGRGTDRVCLDEPETIDRVTQRRRRKERAINSEAPEIQD